MANDLGRFRSGAGWLRRLSSIPKGKAMNITRIDLAGIMVPANPLDRQTPEYLIDWFKARLPFACTVKPDFEPMPTRWTFHRFLTDDVVKVVGGPCDGETCLLDVNTRPGDIVQLRLPVAPLTVEELSATDVINPLTDAGARYNAERMTEALVNYVYSDGVLKYAERRKQEG